ncbi:MAG TPA: hypothetical protein VFC00_31580 [Micromonosporaceae bacterium]|nr:hypothetical protein [Micromonosporaceae bacterium]
MKVAPALGPREFVGIGMVFGSWGESSLGGVPRTTMFHVDSLRDWFQSADVDSVPLRYRHQPGDVGRITDWWLDGPRLWVRGHVAEDRDDLLADVRAGRLGLSPGSITPHVAGTGPVALSRVTPVEFSLTDDPAHVECRITGCGAAPGSGPAVTVGPAGSNGRREAGNGMTMTTAQQREDAECRAKYAHLYGAPVIREFAFTPTTSRPRPAPSRVAVRAAEERRRHGQPAWASYGAGSLTWSGLLLRYDVPALARDTDGSLCWHVLRRSSMDPLFEGTGPGHPLPVLLNHGLLDDDTRSPVLAAALGRAREVADDPGGLRASGLLLDTALAHEVISAVRSWPTPGLSFRMLIEESKLLTDRRPAPDGRTALRVYEVLRGHLVEASFTSDPADPEARLDELGGRPLARRAAPQMSMRQAMEVAAEASGRPGEAQLRSELRGVERELDERARVSRARAFRHRGKPAAPERYARGLSDSQARARLVEIRRELSTYALLAGR